MVIMGQVSIRKVLFSTVHRVELIKTMTDGLGRSGLVSTGIGKS